MSSSLVKFDNPIAVRGGGGALSNGEDILNSILPPRQWTEGQQVWVQFVSSTPATRLDVLTLGESLDRKLQEHKARETGICPVREELYAQCFDELIRQITIACAERGLLLLRVRDQLRETVGSYRSLYESSIAFGMRKALTSEHSKTKLQEEVSGLTGEIGELEEQVEALQLKLKQLKLKEQTRRDKDKETHKAQVAKYSTINRNLKSQLETLLAAPASQPTMDNNNAKPVAASS